MFWPAFLDTRQLENNGDDGDKISTKELALMHPIKQAPVCLQRTSLSQTATVLVDGSAEDYAGPFSEVVTQWRQYYLQHQRKVGEGRICFDFSDPFSRFFDAQDTYLIKRVANSELELAVAQIYGRKHPAVTDINLATGLGQVFLCCGLMAFILTSLRINSFHY